MTDITARFLAFYRYLLAQQKIKGASDFASMIGVSSSLMTELNKGRSKVGLELIQKTVQLFDELNLDWLLGGEGSMIKTMMPPEKVGGGEMALIEERLRGMEANLRSINKVQEKTAEQLSAIKDIISGNIVAANKTRDVKVAGKKGSRGGVTQE